MKYIFSLFFVFAFSSVFAGNPGANYGCLTHSNTKLYTNYIYDDYAPGNPYWGPFNYYDNSPQVYDINYSSNNPTCGQVNPSLSLQDAGKQCFVKIGNSFQQGGLKTFSAGAVVPCPIDDDIAFIFMAIGLIGIYFIKRSPFITS